MTLILLTLLFLLVPQATLSIKVIKSKEKSEIGRAKIKDVELQVIGRKTFLLIFLINLPQAHKELSLCLRFLTPGFSLEKSNFSPLYASVLSLTSLEPLLYWSATDCEEAYSGCTEARREKAGERWGRGKVFGQVLLSAWEENGPGALFNSWNPGEWNSYCFYANSEAKIFQAFLNNKKIFESLSYEGQHLKETTALFLLNSQYYDSALYGSLSDLHIWNRNISLKGN